MKCVLCEKELEMFSEENLQPYGGGEIQLIFAYGSFKHDDFPRATHRGVICDECATPLIEKMKSFSRWRHGTQETETLPAEHQYEFIDNEWRYYRYGRY